MHSIPTFRTPKALDSIKTKAGRLRAINSVITNLKRCIDDIENMGSKYLKKISPSKSRKMRALPKFAESSQRTVRRHSSSSSGSSVGKRKRTLTFDDSENSHNSLDEEDSVSSNDSKNNGYSNSSSNDSDISESDSESDSSTSGSSAESSESSSSEADASCESD